jgi:hypothetical protein
MNDQIEFKGLTFAVSIVPDAHHGEPWKESDGHGPVRFVRGVSAATEKRPGERVLHHSRDGAWLYDWQGAAALAKRDGWGLCDVRMQ